MRKKKNIIQETQIMDVLSKDDFIRLYKKVNNGNDYDSICLSIEQAEHLLNELLEEVCGKITIWRN